MEILGETKEIKYVLPTLICYLNYNKCQKYKRLAETILYASGFSVTAIKKKFPFEIPGSVNFSVRFFFL